MRQARAVWVVAVLLAGCSGQPTEPTAPPTGSFLLPVPIPELGPLEPVVQEQLRSAQAALDDAVRSAREEAELALLFGEQGQRYHAYDLRAAAEACYRNAQELDAADFRWPYYLGRLHHRNGRSDESIDALSRAIDLQPDYIAAHTALARVLLDEQRLDAVEAALASATELDAGSVEVLIGLGRLAAARDDPAGAIRHLEEARRAAPDATEVLYPLGLAYRDAGDPERGRALLQQRRKRLHSKDDPLMTELEEIGTGTRLHVNRGVVAFAERRYDDAALEFRAAIATNPESATAQVNLGSVLSRVGDYQGAVDAYREALRLDPRNFTAHFNLGTLLARANRDDQAVEHYRAALVGDPDYVKAHFNLANALRRLGRFEEAVAHYGRVVQLDPSNVTARLAEALSLVPLERWQEALERLEAAHAAVPEHAFVAQALARLLAASPLDAVRDGSRALDLAREQRAREDSLQLIETEAMALAELGHYGDAVQLQQAAVQAATGAGRQDLARSLRVNLERYRAERPCREPWDPHDAVLSPR